MPRKKLISKSAINSKGRKKPVRNKGQIKRRSTCLFSDDEEVELSQDLNKNNSPFLNPVIMPNMGERLSWPHVGNSSSRPDLSVYSFGEEERQRRRRHLVGPSGDLQTEDSSSNLDIILNWTLSVLSMLAITEDKSDETIEFWNEIKEMAKTLGEAT